MDDHIEFCIGEQVEDERSGGVIELELQAIIPKRSFKLQESSRFEVVAVELSKNLGFVPNSFSKQSSLVSLATLCCLCGDYDCC
jgi:hypothetical protein